jgi:hypothetical protein
MSKSCIPEPAVDASVSAERLPSIGVVLDDAVAPFKKGSLRVLDASVEAATSGFCFFCFSFFAAGAWLAVSTGGNGAGGSVRPVSGNAIDGVDKSVCFPFFNFFLPVLPSAELDRPIPFEIALPGVTFDAIPNKQTP